MYWNHSHVHVHSTNLKTDQQSLSTPDADVLLHLTSSNSYYSDITYTEGATINSTKALISQLNKCLCPQILCGDKIIHLQTLILMAADRIQLCVP